MPSALQAEVVTALLDVFVGRFRLDKVIERRMRANREWVPATREQFVETMHELVRDWRRRWNRAGLPDADYLERINFARAKQVLAAPPLPEQSERGWSEAIRLSVPDWLYALGAAEIGARWSSILAALNQPAPLFLRVNTLRTEPAALITALADEGIAAKAIAGQSCALVVTGRRDVFRTKPFREGWFEVQDVHSQRIAPFLQVEPGLRVVDACAGSGGKSLHLAALMRNKGRIVALDTAEWKLVELRRRAARAGVDNLEAHCLGESAPAKTGASPPVRRPVTPARLLKRFLGTADRVLVDVPCSGLGVLRRNPDAKWKLGTEELARLRTLQAQLLRDYSALTKPGGKLVYATCSVLPSENELQVRAFLDAHPAWRLEEELRLDPQPGGGDGFYAARMVRAVA
jgi:16S rRNA (cytosine967-C5)-methyltransferase